MSIFAGLLLQAVISAPVTTPSIHEIRAAMFERLSADSQRLISGSRWTKERVDEDISNPRTPKIEHREQYAVYGDGTRMLQRKTLRDGVALHEPSRPLSFFLEPSLLEKYEFTLSEPIEVPCDDHECWRLSFAPRVGLIDDVMGDDDRKMFAASVGTLLIEKGSHAIVRVDAHMAQPLHTWLYTIEWSSVTITQTLHDGVAVVATIEISYAYKTFFSRKTKRRFYRTVGVMIPPS